MTTWDRVTIIAADLSGTDKPIGPLTPVGRGGLELDSLDKINLVMALEEEFGVEITDDETDRPALATIGGLVAFVQDKLDKRAERISDAHEAGAFKTPMVVNADPPHGFEYARGSVTMLPAPDLSDVSAAIESSLSAAAILAQQTARGHARRIFEAGFLAACNMAGVAPFQFEPAWAEFARDNGFKP